MKFWNDANDNNNNNNKSSHILRLPHTDNISLFGRDFMNNTPRLFLLLSYKKMGKNLIVISLLYLLIYMRIIKENVL